MMEDELSPEEQGIYLRTAKRTENAIISAAEELAMLDSTGENQMAIFASICVRDLIAAYQTIFPKHKPIHEVLFAEHIHSRILDAFDERRNKKSE